MKIHQQPISENHLSAMFFDGVKYDSSGGSNPVDGTLSIGDWVAYDRKFQGKIDDVRIYSRALSDLDVNTIYNSGNGI
jgi:hypothetical protein